MSTPIPIGDVARRFGLSVDTLRRWTRSGKVRCWRDVRGRRLLDAEEIEALMRPVEDKKKPDAGEGSEARHG